MSDETAKSSENPGTSSDRRGFLTKSAVLASVISATSLTSEAQAHDEEAINLQKLIRSGIEKGDLDEAAIDEFGRGLPHIAVETLKALSPEDWKQIGVLDKKLSGLAELNIPSAHNGNVGM